MLYWNTVSPLLKSSLIELMSTKELGMFRLVGGTALSLHLGHRMSIDIDLFTDVEYGSLDFSKIEDILKDKFDYVYTTNIDVIAFGKSYIIGKNENDSVKLDIYYTDKYIQPAFETEGIRLATIEEIAAMKLDVVQRGGRKKDFWDIHEILEKYSLNQLIAFHKLRYEFNHDEGLILKNLIEFSSADMDFDPICLKGKHWELIKYELIHEVQRYTQQ
ncbi:nucleotidyltransferase AbiEii toxin of type IV toxin-antitoxin system [Chitinophaga skermanii]|uniref:Nucleotidyltransferase AbiEii toxin of type IV toxin-antitoxin system n=1 Tax=Chitinophaga skermanii TaxID=331697 RepID=A0A327QAN6_9BACT|nr:nucleotidyl transferase AbiEii/AbiGii toxin family protein [Chitinophaga skermanii]RAJ01599.1 nucleotidyltransferase AbiEii toxin of type IV toxin-antitoxin system [Chitinophaga skermanii]